MRQCDKCQVTIDECMGFVNAGDILDFLDNKIVASEVRELCGICILKNDINLAKEAKSSLN